MASIIFEFCFRRLSPLQSSQFAGSSLLFIQKLICNVRDQYLQEPIIILDR